MILEMEDLGTINQIVRINDEDGNNIDTFACLCSISMYMIEDKGSFVDILNKIEPDAFKKIRHHMKKDDIPDSFYELLDSANEKLGFENKSVVEQIFDNYFIKDDKVDFTWINDKYDGDDDDDSDNYGMFKSAIIVMKAEGKYNRGLPTIYKSTSINGTSLWEGIIDKLKLRLQESIDSIVLTQKNKD